MERPTTFKTIPPEYVVTIGSNTYDLRKSPGYYPPHFTRGEFVDELNGLSEKIRKQQGVIKQNNPLNAYLDLLDSRRSDFWKYTWKKPAFDECIRLCRDKETFSKLLRLSAINWGGEIHNVIDFSESQLPEHGKIEHCSCEICVDKTLRDNYCIAGCCFFTGFGFSPPDVSTELLIDFIISQKEDVDSNGFSPFYYEVAQMYRILRPCSFRPAVYYELYEKWNRYKNGKAIHIPFMIMMSASFSKNPLILPQRLSFVIYYQIISEEEIFNNICRINCLTRLSDRTHSDMQLMDPTTFTKFYYQRLLPETLILLVAIRKHCDTVLSLVPNELMLEIKFWML
jgi:hypothetical protein